MISQWICSITCRNFYLIYFAAWCAAAAFLTVRRPPSSERDAAGAAAEAAAAGEDRAIKLSDESSCFARIIIYGIGVTKYQRQNIHCI